MPGGPLRAEQAGPAWVLYAYDKLSVLKAGLLILDESMCEQEHGTAL